jgi:hypothetical protein
MDSTDSKPKCKTTVTNQAKANHEVVTTPLFKLAISLAAPTPSNGPYAGMRIGEASMAFLVQAGSPQKTRTIANALEQGGIKSTDIYRAVYNALDNNDELELDDMKRWRLKKWAEG